MSVKLNFQKDKVIATFSGNIEENEVRNTFIDIVEKVSIKKMSCIIFDFTNILSYTIPPDFINLLKMVTHFSASWNGNVKGIMIATRPNVVKAANQIINNQALLKWDYFLFDNLNDVLNCCKSK